jgi:hypothetical protein
MSGEYLRPDLHLATPFVTQLTQRTSPRSHVHRLPGPPSSPALWPTFKTPVCFTYALVSQLGWMSTRVPPAPQHLIYFQVVDGAPRDLEDVGLGDPRRLFHAAVRRERWQALDEAPQRSAAAMV